MCIYNITFFLNRTSSNTESNEDVICDTDSSASFQVENKHCTGTTPGNN